MPIPCTGLTLMDPVPRSCRERGSFRQRRVPGPGSPVMDPRGALSNAPHHLNPSWDLQAEQVRVSTHQHKDAHGHDRTKDQRDTAQLSGCRGQRR